MDNVAHGSVRAVQDAFEKEGMRFTEDGCICPPPAKAKKRAK
jgi:hypothetical protein